MSAGPLQPSTVLASVGMALLGFVLFVATGQDDPYISYWPAHTLVQFGEMVNYNGERVEQSSSLLHVLLLAIASGVSRTPVPVAGYWIGVVAGFITLLRACVLSERLGYARTAWLPLLLGSTSIYIYWWFGGLETALVGWLGVEAAIAACDVAAGRARAGSPRLIAVTLAMVMVRPESFLVLGLSVAAWWLVERLPAAKAKANANGSDDPLRGRILGWLGVIAVCTVAVTGFRWFYFDALMPQPVSAKIGAGSLDRLVSGLRYTLQTGILRPYALPFFGALLVVPLLGVRALRGGGTSAGERFTVLLVLATVAFTVTSGGDWMRGGRFFAHFAPLVVVLCVGALSNLRLSPRLRTVGFALALVGNLSGMALLVGIESTGRPLWEFWKVDARVREHTAGVDSDWTERASRIRTRDLLFLPETLRVVDATLQLQPRVVVLSRQAGMVMYYLAERFYPRIDFFDLHGLTSRTLTDLRDELELVSESNGVKMTLNQYLDHAEREEALPMPDVIFDLGVRSKPPRGGAYSIVYQQAGASPGVPIGFGDRPWRMDFSVEQYLAVRRELAPRVMGPTRVFDWSREIARSQGRLP